jgi:FtsZ-interacting cell division protein ZipA
MNVLNKYLFFFILSFSLITCATIEELEINTINEISLTESENEYSLPIEIPDDQKMVIELVFSHPSKYDVKFSSTLVEELLKTSEEEGKNKNILLYDDKTKKRYIHPKRHLLTEEASVEPENDSTTFGKRTITLNLDNTTDSIIININAIEGAELSGEEKVYLKYCIVKTIEEKYTLIDTKINVEKEKDILNITFKGIKQLDEDEVLFAYFYIKIFDKESLDSKFENIYIYPYSKEVEPLISKELRLKGKMVQLDNYIKIKANLNDKNEQILFINVEVKNLNGEGQSFQYEEFTFNVEEESGERVWPEEEESPEEEHKEEESKEEEPQEEESPKPQEEESKEDEPQKEEEDNTNKEEEEEDYRKENKSKFTIILICFIVSVILTMIGVLIYIKFFSKNENSIEEETDYKDVGGIVKNNEETDKGDKGEKEKAINESEE